MGVPFMAVMCLQNGRLDWDLGSLEAKVEDSSPLSCSWRKELTMSAICRHATLSSLGKKGELVQHRRLSVV